MYLNLPPHARGDTQLCGLKSRNAQKVACKHSPYAAYNGGVRKKPPRTPSLRLYINPERLTVNLVFL